MCENVSGCDGERMREANATLHPIAMTAEFAQAFCPAKINFKTASQQNFGWVDKLLFNVRPHKVLAKNMVANFLISGATSYLIFILHIS